MQARRFLTFLAALLVTSGQALIFAADTKASAPSAVPAIGHLGEPRAPSSEL
jgi:hypothetical protein